jgi:hypothetical protein
MKQIQEASTELVPKLLPDMESKEAVQEVPEIVVQSISIPQEISPESKKEVVIQSVQGWVMSFNSN